MTLHVPNLATDQPSEPQTTIAVPGLPQGAYAQFFKRFLDVTLVLLTAPVVLPLIALLGLAIALTGNMPFYSQLRVGRDGTPFRMWKLRTMVRDADARLETCLVQNPAARAEWDATQKLKNDPRITPLGRMLRKTSVDELPQLFNVLNGTMALVGPRPMMVGQEKYYQGQAYYQLRPGITGTWQVSDRNNCTFQERAAHDEVYGRDISLAGDRSILVRTISVVCRATGH